MRELLKSMVEGFLEGARRAPRDFFAPVVGLARWVNRQAAAAAEENIRRTARKRTAGR